MRHHLALSAAIATSCAVLSGCGGGGSPNALLQQAIKDGIARGSVHESSLGGLGYGIATFTSDVTTDGGEQDLTMDLGIDAHVIVAGDVAYVSGNTLFLEQYVSAAEAHTIGDHWLEIPSSDSAYAGISDDVTLTSAMDDLKLTGPLSETAPMTVDGQSVVGITGTATLRDSTSPGTGTVYVSRTGTPLPVAATYTYATGATVNVILDHWGEHVAVHVPANIFHVEQQTSA